MQPEGQDQILFRRYKAVYLAVEESLPVEAEAGIMDHSKY
jgi:hypothetical protein